MGNYTKGRDLMPMIRKMEPIDISKETPMKLVPTTTGVWGQCSYYAAITD